MVSHVDAGFDADYANLASSLQLQHDIYGQLMATAAPEVKNVLSTLLQSKTAFTADVEQFWTKTMRRPPSLEQLQMLRVLQGQCMVIADLEKQMEHKAKSSAALGIDQTGLQKQPPSAGWHNNPAGKHPRAPEVAGIQDQSKQMQAPKGPKADVQGASLIREGTPASGGVVRPTSLEHRKPEDIAKAAKSKRRDAKPALPYEKIAQVGEGTYGKVYKARNSEGVGLVALKRIRMEGEKDGFPVTAMREIKLLQGLDHVNVVKLHEMMISNGKLFGHDRVLQSNLPHPQDPCIWSWSIWTMISLAYYHNPKSRYPSPISNRFANKCFAGSRIYIARQFYTGT